MKFYCIWVPHYLYPFILWWTSKSMLLWIEQQWPCICKYICSRIWKFFWSEPRCHIAGPYENFIFNFMRYLHTDVHNGSESLHSDQQRISDSLSLLFTSIVILCLCKIINIEFIMNFFKSFIYEYCICYFSLLFLALTSHLSPLIHQKFIVFNF